MSDYNTRRGKSGWPAGLVRYFIGYAKAKHPPYRGAETVYFLQEARWRSRRGKVRWVNGVQIIEWDCSAHREAVDQFLLNRMEGH